MYESILFIKYYLFWFKAIEFIFNLFLFKDYIPGYFSDGEDTVNSFKQKRINGRARINSFIFVKIIIIFFKSKDIIKII